jgi:hypothetical protein
MLLGIAVLLCCVGAAINWATGKDTFVPMVLAIVYLGAGLLFHDHRGKREQ